MPKVKLCCLSALFAGAAALYAPAQTLSFLQELPAPGMIGSADIVADASGVYVLVSQGQGSATIRKFDSSGSELWTRQIRPPAPGTVLLLRRAFADSTGVYVLADVANPDPESPSRFLRKYSGAGDELWTKPLQSFSAVAVDATGLYVANGRPPESASVSRYTPAGTEVWTVRSENPDLPFGLTVDSTGVYVIGALTQAPSGPFSGLSSRKFDHDGNRLWTRQLPFFPFSIPSLAPAEPAGFHLAARGPAGRVHLSRFDSSGQEAWSRDVAGWSDAGPIADPRIAADASGVYIAGGLNWAQRPLPGQCRSGSGGDSFIRKYNADGEEVWTRQFGPPEGSLPGGVAVNASGVFVTGVGGAAPFWDDASIPDAFAPGNRTSHAYLARFEKAAAAASVSGPRIYSGCVVNAANYVGGGIAPGEIVTIFGSRLGDGSATPSRLSDDGTLSTSLADTRVLFGGVPAPVLYVSETQVSAIVPFALPRTTFVDVQVEFKGVRSLAETVPVLTSRPGIFTLDRSGGGQAAVLNSDGTLNSRSNPARRGSVISIFGTGGASSTWSPRKDRSLAALLQPSSCRLRLRSAPPG